MRTQPFLATRNFENIPLNRALHYRKNKSCSIFEKIFTKCDDTWKFKETIDGNELNYFQYTTAKNQPAMMTVHERLNSEWRWADDLPKYSGGDVWDGGGDNPPGGGVIKPPFFQILS